MVCWRGLIFDIIPDILHAKLVHSLALGCAVSAYKTNAS